ncbi:MAG: ATP-binding cassette domain-containing protein [Bacteroidetes bacterium]|nr:ATP-binding cassette domain-containing protein [Bacteroidota bacterium]
MQVELIDIGKRFNRQWIFKGINHTFLSNSATALTGNNGSGKSTLLQLIYNFQTFSKGNISYTFNQELLTEEALQGQMVFAAPYLDLPEEFTLNEMLAFHFKLLPLCLGSNLSEILLNSGLQGNEHKFIKHFSSGMKQRLKLVLALFSDTPLLLLDEPCTNLDEKGTAWYRDTIQSQLGKRTIIIASNQTQEYDFCTQVLNVTSFKPLAI